MKGEEIGLRLFKREADYILPPSLNPLKISTNKKKRSNHRKKHGAKKRR